MTGPPVVEIEGSVQCRECELGNHLHGPVEAACIGPINGQLHHGTTVHIDAPSFRRRGTCIHVCKDAITVNISATHAVNHQSSRCTFTFVKQVVHTVRIRVSFNGSASKLIDIRGVNRRLWTPVKFVSGTVDVVDTVVVIVVILCRILAAIVVPIRCVIRIPIGHTLGTPIIRIAVVVVVVVIILVKV